jgi:D-3-phosphoglycerate dehydrogenase / 2-oxoglutarate reductase
MGKRYHVLNMANLDAAEDALKPLEEVAEVVTVPANQDALLRLIPDFDSYYAALAVRADAQVLERGKRLKAIATPSTGLDHIDVPLARKLGIEIVCIKEDIEFLSRITATAELAWALMLAVVRKIPSGFEAARRGYWARDVFRGHQLSGKTFGILGYGRLGRIVGEYAKAFRMRVLACDVKDFAAEGIQRVDFDTLLRESDVVSLHVHLTQENRGLISREAFGKMKPGAILINTSRGAVVDEAAFLEALESGRLAGAGVDVIEGEWRTDLDQHPLIRYARSHDNFVIMPHVGGVTYESQAMTLEFTAEKLARFLRNL